MTDSREMKKRCGAEAAIDRAIEEMPKDFLIREFVVAHRAEVKDMCLTEYNEAEVLLYSNE